MPILLELLRGLIPALLGAGASWFIQPRLMARRQATMLHQADFNTVSEVVKKAMEQLAEMADRIAVLERENITLQKELNAHQRTILKMQREIDAWEAGARDLVQPKNDEPHG